MRPAGRDMAAGGGATAGARFTMRMRGHVTFGEQDHRAGARAGRASGTDLAIRLAVVIPSVDGFMSDPQRRARARGHVRCPALGGELPIEFGVCSLLSEADDQQRRRVLLRMHFRDAVGHPLTLDGFQSIGDSRSSPGGIWRDTSTLFTRVVRGHGAATGDLASEVVASGVLQLRAIDLALQVASLRMRGTTRRERSRSRTALLTFVSDEISIAYGRGDGKTAVWG